MNLLNSNQISTASSLISVNNSTHNTTVVSTNSTFSTASILSNSSINNYRSLDAVKASTSKTNTFSDNFTNVKYNTIKKETSYEVNDKHDPRPASTSSVLTQQSLSNLNISPEKNLLLANTDSEAFNLSTSTSAPSFVRKRKAPLEHSIDLAINNNNNNNGNELEKHLNFSSNSSNNYLSTQISNSNNASLTTNAFNPNVFSSQFLNSAISSTSSNFAPKNISTNSGNYFLLNF